MRKFMIIAYMGNDFSIQIVTKADTTIQAISKASEYCLKEGYFATELKGYEILDNIGIIEI